MRYILIALILPALQLAQAKSQSDALLCETLKKAPSAAALELANLILAEEGRAYQDAASLCEIEKEAKVIRDNADKFISEQEEE